jgi:hypothetical protein
MNAKLTVLLLAITGPTAMGQTDTKTVPMPADPKSEGLVVHEWGTFTSFSGPSGDIMPFTINIGEQLPDFVQARAGAGWGSVRDVHFEKFELLAEQRMETPVLYFYSDKPADVSVNVSMPHGLITEVFPPVTAAVPATTQWSIPAAGSSVRWDHVGVVPSYCCDFLTLSSGGESHYYQARATKANTLKVVQGDQTFGERFLFYRGIAKGDMGLKAKALGNDAFRLERSDAGALSSVFAIEVAGQQVRFAQAQNVQPGAEIRLPKDNTTADSLGAAMAQSLRNAGLFEDESQAMVNTWKHLWFGESGTRLMVIVPQTTVDQELPLTIAPAPKQLKRVFVARLEMLTPERVQWTADLLARLVAAPESQREAIYLELNTFGRFQGPAIKIGRESLAKQAVKPAAKPD